MFAGSIQSIVCHLLDSEVTSTVCGLKVSRFAGARRLGGRLHVLTSKPEDCRICKHCVRIVGETSAQIEGSLKNFAAGFRSRVEAEP
jgi:hypothetical protein